MTADGSPSEIRYDPLVGGEAVPIDLRVARIGSRAVAYFIDLLLELIVFAFLTGVINNLPLESAATIALSITSLVLVFIGYPVILETAWSGRTLGKAAMGLATARDDGGPARFRHALVRALLWVFVDGFMTLGIAGVITSMLSERGKRVGDYLAGTVVLHVRVPQTGAYVPPLGAWAGPLAGWATTLDLSRFPDVLALQCRQFLGRAGQLTPEARERLGASLVASVQAVVAPPPPPGTPGWAYVTAVLAERRRREELRMQRGPVPQVTPMNVLQYPAAPPAATQPPPLAGPASSGGFVPPA